MNNYRLSSFKGSNNQPILPSLINEVLRMEDIYIKNHEGLRINFTNRTLVKGQLFYILAKDSSDNILIFKDSKTCGDYFGLNYQTINVKLNKGVSIKDSNNLEFKLYRKPLQQLKRGLIHSPLSQYEYFTYESKIISQKALTDLETSYINRFNFDNLYNFKAIATSSLGYKHTEEARLKMKDIYKDKNNHPMFGKTLRKYQL